MTSYRHPDRPDPDDRHPRWAGEPDGAHDPDGRHGRRPGKAGGAKDPDDRHARWAGEAGGVYDPDDPGPAGGSPLPGLADALDQLEDAKRRVLDRYRDVAAWGGTAQTTGYTQAEWLTLVGRLAGRDAWRYDLLVRRLPALPVTATLLATGQLTLDQATTIVAGTRRLSGDTLAAVDREAAHVALSRNHRGDDPDMESDVEAIVQATKQAADQDRLDRDRLDRNQARIEPDLFGAGRIIEDWADPEGFQTRLAGLESAAGQPSPDVPRSQQLAEGSLAMARAWLAGTPTGTTSSDATTATAADNHPAGADTATTTDNATADRFGPADSGGTAARSHQQDADTATAETATNGDTDDPAPADHVGPEDIARPHDPNNPTDLDDAVDLDDAIDPADVADLRPSGARPTLVVRIDVTDLAGIDPDDPTTLRRLSAGAGAAMGRLAAAGRLSSTPWLGRQLLDTLACNADLTVAVVDGERPLAEFRHTTRLPDRIRRQILWRDLGCRWPGCRSPIAHVDVHHLDQHPSNHDVDNLLSLCRKHHRRLHTTFWHPHLDGRTGRFDLRRSPTGPAVHTTFPRGTRPRAQSPPEVAPAR